MLHQLAIWWAVLLAALGTGSPQIISYGPLPQRIVVYDHAITTVDYWNGPLTLDTNDFSYTRGEQRFRNPSNYGLLALPDLSQPWINRRLHFDEHCNQLAPLSERQQRAIRFIVERAEPLPNGAVTWRYDFDLNFGQVVFQAGFNSAFSQSVNTAALLFAECKTGNDAYFTLAKKAALAIIAPISDGGVMNTENGLTFFEELPAPNGHSPYILNAHILSVNVLFAMAARTSDERFKDYAERGVETLIKLAPEYTATPCIKYALKQTEDGCHPDYDVYETVLLDDMYLWTGDDRVIKLADQWRRQAATVPRPP